jgi:hypothetical protein
MTSRGKRSITAAIVIAVAIVIAGFMVLAVDGGPLVLIHWLAWAPWAGVGFLVLVAAAIAWWWVPKWQANRLRLKIRDPKARADVEDNFRKTIGQLLGGAAVLEASKAQIISQQVAKGFEQLGSKDNIVLRLGGIYALEGVMNTSEQYHQPVLEALCAFVREKAKVKIDKEKTKNKGPGSLAADIQAALTVIGRRKAGPGYVDLSGANLSSAFLSGADLSHAKLFGASLSRAKLSRANLDGANLNGADLSHAKLFGADLSGASLSRANLSGANLDGANGANLTGAFLSRANLSGANLSRANLSDAIGLFQSQLDKACGDKDTKLPSGLTIKPCQP